MATKWMKKEQAMFVSVGKNLFLPHMKFKLA